MSKTFINDYSGLGSVFMDGLLGALLSTGVFVTLLSKLVEMFGLDFFLRLNILHLSLLTNLTQRITCS